MAEKIKLQIGLPVEMVAQIDSIASEMGMTRSQLCNYWIADWVYRKKRADGLFKKREDVQDPASEAPPAH